VTDRLPWSGFRPPDPPLADDAVVLRLPRDADAPAIAEACRDPEIARWIPVPIPYDIGDARAFIAFAAEGWATRREATWVIAEQTTGALLGTISYRPIEPGRGAVGYWLAPESRGAGRATRAVLLVARWAFGDHCLERIDLMTLVGNDASGRVALRAGFRHEGRLRRYLRFRDRMVDVEMYSVLRADVRAAR
jgi:RimJ/RimL family protein N-acetyltransferase